MLLLDLKIIGPGLVVNHATAVVYDALKRAGYDVDLREFDGQYQYLDKEHWPDNQLQETRNDAGTPIHINMSVSPEPWGG